MSAGALILTYHAVEPGPPPLCVDPALFRQHLDAIEAAGATAVTVSELAAALEAGSLPERAVAITFDDGFASVAEHAAPLLAERGLRSTLYAVAGALGGQNDWPSQPEGAPRRPLLDGAQLTELADAGFEIGSHGVEHAPLAHVTEAGAWHEVVHSRELLEDLLGRPVESFAFPYGAAPVPYADRLVRVTYSSACATTLAPVSEASDRHALPRVDAHYLRRPELLRRALEGSLRGYLRLRRAGASSRRLARKDYSLA